MGVAHTSTQAVVSEHLLANSSSICHRATRLQKDNRITNQKQPPPWVRKRLISTSRTSPSRRFVVEASAVTPRTTHPRVPTPSTPRSSFLTTLVKLVLATLLSWIATPPTLPASSPSSSRRSIVVPESPLRT